MAPKRTARKKALTKKSPKSKSATKKTARKESSAKKRGKEKPPAKRTTKHKAPVRKQAALKTASGRRKPLVRRDPTGHLDPSYARGLRRNSLENVEHDDDRGFLIGRKKDDALAQELGREFVETVTSGEDEGVELRDEVVTEEVGGPFVTTTRGQEVAEEPDESNPVGSTREPFPKT